MARVTFLGDGPVEWFGLDFSPNKPVDLSETTLLPERQEALIAKAKENPFFEVSGVAAKTDEDDQEEDLDGFKIMPTGRGWFKIEDPEGKIVAEGLRKKDAEAKVIELAADRG